MEGWEKELVDELRRTGNGGVAPPGNDDDDDTDATDPLTAAFRDLLEKTGRSITRIAEAADLRPYAKKEEELGRYRWSVQGRHLRVRIDRDAQKFFVSLESDAGLALCELWIDEGRLLTDADGAARPADLDAIVQRHVTRLFRGASPSPSETGP